MQREHVGGQLTEGRGGVDVDVVPLAAGGDPDQDDLDGRVLLLRRPPLLHQHPTRPQLPLDLLVLGDHGVDVSAAACAAGAPGAVPEQTPRARNLHHLALSLLALSSSASVSLPITGHFLALGAKDLLRPGILKRGRKWAMTTKREEEVKSRQRPPCGNDWRLIRVFV
jgi:hypothetical protein